MMMKANELSDDQLVPFLRDFDYKVIPGPEFGDWEEAVHELSDRVGDGPNRELARRVIPEMLRALEETDPRKQEDIDVRDTALHLLEWTPELLDERAKKMLRAVVVEDNVADVGWIAADILEGIDPAEGDEAWRAYTNRPDAPPHLKDLPKRSER